MLRITGGKYRGRKIITAKNSNTRPTMSIIREAIFNILKSRRSLINCKILDVFSGSGALTFEALSRGAHHSFVVDSNYDNLQFVKKTAQHIGAINDITLVYSNAESLPKAPTQCDIVFIDPPYHSQLIETTLNILYQGSWLKDDSIITLEIKKDETFTLPTQYEIISNRLYGIAKVLFLELK